MTAVTLTSCGWKGIASVPLPVGPGTGENRQIVYVQVPDTLALNVNSRVRVADVGVGTVRAIELKNWIPTLTVGLEPGIKLPANATARIGQSSIPGTQHLELAAPPNPSPQPPQGRCDDPAEEFLGVPDRADSGEPGDRAAWWRYPQPRGHRHGRPTTCWRATLPRFGNSWAG